MDQPPQSPSSPASDLAAFLARAGQLLDRLEPLLPPAGGVPDWSAAIAFHWRRRGSAGFLQPVLRPHTLALADLVDIDAQKARVVANTRQFLVGAPANNVLLTGSRGCGKSSLVKALLDEFASQGLRLVEIDRDHLDDLPALVDLLIGRPERFIVFCDDLSFEAGDATYKALKVVLDGSIAAPPDNVLIYATSNRRHLMPEYFAENRETHRVDDEIHPGEAIEEKVSLSERFGLWVSFYPFSQEEYLRIVAGWMAHFGGSAADIAAAERDALNWALLRGARNGRVAWQFAKDWAGSRLTGAA